VDRLRAVITWTPEDRAQPFAALDLLYANIVSAAKEAYEAAHPERDFLLLLNVCRLLHRHMFDVPSYFSEVTDLGDDAYQCLISDLRSFVTTKEASVSNLLSFSSTQFPAFNRLHFYHKSLADFLASESRSKNLFVPNFRAVELVTASCVRALDKDDRVCITILLGMLYTESQPGSSDSASRPLRTRIIVCQLLFLEFNTGPPESSCILHLLSTGSNSEKIKRWEKVDNLVNEWWEELADKVKVSPAPLKTLVEDWLALLSHALMDPNVSC
jgi:hypothetical protein